MSVNQKDDIQIVHDVQTFKTVVDDNLKVINWKESYGVRMWETNPRPRKQVVDFYSNIDYAITPTIKTILVVVRFN